MRERLFELLTRVRHASSSAIQNVARRLKQGREAKQDAEARHARLADLPREVSQIADRLRELTSQTSESSRQLGSLERDIRSKRANLEALNAHIGKLQEVLASLGPDQKRIAVAERVHRSLTSVIDQIQPIILRRIQDLVTSHFVSVADRRYREGKIHFPDEHSPVLRYPGHPDQLIEMMSGFERRSFGIAFSLALAEMTKVRVPLVIDTPMGNADTEYRPRLLKALTNVDLDQIIILTHDAEVTGPLFEAIEDKVQQTFLVQFDREKGESVVLGDEFF
jgi:DNA sulfur modification protein DndD